WQVQGMDCPSCAQKVEAAVKQLAGIIAVRVVFDSEKLLVDANDDIRSQVEQAVAHVGFRLQRSDAAAPAIEARFWQENRSAIVLALLMAASWLLGSIPPGAGTFA
ncbi:cation transporter, partial [Erwinia amylovora]|uniref:cation transporter n=1 Tax=Erwinia amylovora TaxID=552 RepID=UPI002961FC1A